MVLYYFIEASRVTDFQVTDFYSQSYPFIMPCKCWVDAARKRCCCATVAGRLHSWSFTYRTSQALAAALGISLRMPPLRRWQKSHAEILRGCKVQCSEGQRWQSATAKSKHLKLHLSLMCFRFATVHGSAWFSRLAAPAQVPDIFPACCTRSANSSRSRSTYAGGSRLQTILCAAAAKDERRPHKFLKGCVSQGRLNRSLSLYWYL